MLLENLHVFPQQFLKESSVSFSVIAVFGKMPSNPVTNGSIEFHLASQ